jgi:hypothetical protein
MLCGLPVSSFVCGFSFSSSNVFFFPHTCLREHNHFGNFVVDNLREFWYFWFWKQTPVMAAVVVLRRGEKEEQEQGFYVCVACVLCRKRCRF